MFLIISFVFDRAKEMQNMLNLEKDITEMPLRKF